MNDAKPRLEFRETLLGLIDDTHPAVRRALLAHFAAADDEAARFLREVAASPHRIHAWHARWFLKQLRFTDPVAEFRTFIRSLNYELKTGALMLSRTVFPQVDAGWCCEQLDAIAQRCRELIVEPASAREKCRVINRVLFHDCGFRANLEHYTDPLNSFLPFVLERKKGIPLSLSLVYLLTGQRLGLELEPVALPGHFVVGCYTDDTPFFVDPFEQGALRTPHDLFDFLRRQQIEPKVHDLAPTPVREVLCRSCRNLVHHYHEAGDESHARLFESFVEEFDAAYERHMS